MFLGIFPTVLPNVLAQFTATGSYAVGNVESSATPLTVGTFSSQVATAFTAGNGGVVNFESGVLTSPNANDASATMDILFGAGKTLQVTRNDGTGMKVTSADSTRSPISGTKMLGLGGEVVADTDTGQRNDFIFELGAITGGAANERVVAFGITLLSRNGNGWPNTVSATAQFDDGSSSSVTGVSMPKSNGGGDTFFGFAAPAGRYIAAVVIDLPVTGYNADGSPSGAYTSTDDLAFITAPVATAVLNPPVNYLATARAYADALLTSGRDTYGTQSSPMIASMLDRHTLSLPAAPIRTTLPNLASNGVRFHDRSWDGSNVGHDHELYLLLYALADATGDANYATQADAALSWWMENTQSPVTGLLAWGEHLGWDFRRDATIQQFTNSSMSTFNNDNQTHEFTGDWELWGRVRNFAPTRIRRFAQALWDHQIGDKATGDFSRHAKYDQHSVSTGASFPRHGGYFIATWAQAWAEAPDVDENPALFKKADMLTAINAVADQFNNRRRANDALPAGSNSPVDSQYFTSYWQQNDLGMAVAVWRVIDLLPADEAAKVRSLALRSDDVIVNKVPNDLVTPGKGFVHRAYVDTLIPGDPRRKGHPDFSALWEAGYGDPSTASYGVLMAQRYRQLSPYAQYVSLAAGYRGYVLQAADLYLESEPAPGQTVVPIALAEAIQLMLRAHEITGDAVYLKRADYFGRRASALFLTGGSPLPKVTSAHDHYETITGGDDLMLAMFDLAKALPAVTLEATTDAQEFGTTAGTFTVRRSGPTDASLAIKIASGGTAVSGNDYQPIAQEIVIPTGAETATVHVVPVADSTVEGDETVTLSLVLDDPTGVPYQAGASPTAAIRIRDKPMDNWRFMKSLTGPGSGDFDDPDGDGVPNVMEYAQGLDPHKNEPASAPLSVLAVRDSVSYVALEFGSLITATDVVLSMEGSDNLTEWRPIANRTEVLGLVGDTERVRWFDDVPISNGHRRFLRLTVERLP